MRRIASPFKVIALSFCLTLCVCAVLFGDLFWRFDQSFLWHHDAEIPYHGTFLLVSYFFQGGLQIFDRFDGMMFAFTHLAHGFYTVANSITAFFFILISPFSSSPAQDFHHFYSIFFQAVNILIRTLGGYLLLRKFSISFGVTVISLVILNTFLSTTMYFGFVANNLYSYYPLLMFFILNFFETFRCRDFIGMMLIFTIAAASTPLLAMGYFYQNVHFLILSSIVYGLIFYRRNIKLTAIAKMINLKSLGLAGLICALIMAPWAMLFKLLGTDFYIEGSGLGGTHGRFNNMFDPTKYFAPKGETILDLKQFCFKLIDFSNTEWEKSWIFWGASVVILIIAAIVCAKVRQKYIILATAGLILLTNVPLNSPLPFSVAHWINALTNPLSFLLRSYHMPVLLLPYVIFPLVAMGLQAGRDIIDGKIIGWRVWTLVAVYVGLLFLSALFLPLAFKVYMLIVLTFALLILYVSNHHGLELGGLNKKHLSLALFAVMMLIDGYALKQYYDSNEYQGATENRGGYLSKNDGRHIKPSVYEGFDDDRKLIIEYQNPKILPFREYVRIRPTTTDPRMHTWQGPYGDFLRYQPFERYFEPLDLYTPRAKIFKDFAQNIPLYQGLAREQRQFSLAMGTPEGPSQTLPQRESRFQIVLDHAKVQLHGSIKVYQYRLPKKFPSYEATTIFTEDRKRLTLEGLGTALTPVQGAVTESYTFDVNNVRNGYITFALPKETTLGHQEITLVLKQSGDILNVWKNTEDDLGLTFLAMTNGVLRTRFPNDSRWKVFVDGKKTSTLSVDHYFLGVPVLAGQHRVLFRYWPESPLRVLIPLSVILAVGALCWVVLNELLEKQL